MLIGLIAHMGNPHIRYSIEVRVSPRRMPNCRMMLSGVRRKREHTEASALSIITLKLVRVGSCPICRRVGGASR